MSAETPKAVVPFTEEWFAYIISTRTEEGSIRCLSMMTQAELQRLRGLLDEATDMLYEGAGYADEVTDSEGADEFARRARTFLAKLKK